MRKHLTKLEKEKISKYYDIVKKHVNILDPEGLLPDCGEEEYNPEITEICLRIGSNQTVKRIAKILYVIFSYYFSVNDVFTVEYFTETAKNIKGEME